MGRMIQIKQPSRLLEDQATLQALRGSSNLQELVDDPAANNRVQDNLSKALPIHHQQVHLVYTSSGPYINQLSIS
jgi:hypothetical protein